MPIMQCNGININYEVSGSGPNVLLLHGNGASLRFFDALTALLEPCYTVYRMDSRRHGKSEKSKEITYDLMAEDTAEFIKALDIRCPALIGSSDGGITGLLLTIKYPQLLSCHIPCGANTSIDGLKRWFYWVFKLGYLKTRSPLYNLVISQPEICKQALAGITTPTMVMAGSKDIITNDHTKYMAAAIPKARLCIIEGRGHTSYLKKPEVFMKHAAGFLEEYK